MPNNITNEITASAHVLGLIATLLKGDESDVDFNQLIPMPSDIIRGHLTSSIQAASNGRNWLDWSLKCWGTKWNAYMVDVNTSRIRFDTAWSLPRSVVEALASRKIGVWVWSFADEDIGNNCGTVACDAHGELTYSTPDDPTVFALNLKGWDVEEYNRETDEGGE